jgi:hypothetical protein
MKTVYKDDKIEVIPENMFEQAYLNQFIYSMAYGEYQAYDEQAERLKEDKLVRLIIPINN